MQGNFHGKERDTMNVILGKYGSEEIKKFVRDQVKNLEEVSAMDYRHILGKNHAMIDFFCRSTIKKKLRNMEAQYEYQDNIDLVERNGMIKFSFSLDARYTDPVEKWKHNASSQGRFPDIHCIAFKETAFSRKPIGLMPRITDSMFVIKGSTANYLLVPIQ